jgi:hypothetical protein
MCMCTHIQVSKHVNKRNVCSQWGWCAHAHKYRCPNMWTKGMYTASVSEENIASICMETVCSSATLVPTYKTTQCQNQNNSMNVHSLKTSDINTQVSGTPLKKTDSNWWISIYLSALHLRNVQTNEMATAVSYCLMLGLHSQRSQHVVQKCRVDCLYP